MAIVPLENSLRTVAILHVTVVGEALLRAPEHLVIFPLGRGKAPPPPTPMAAAALLRSVLDEYHSHNSTAALEEAPAQAGCCLLEDLYGNCPATMFPSCHRQA